MICHCGASCRASETKEGEVHTCPACGRREVKKRQPETMELIVELGAALTAGKKTLEQHHTGDLFE